MCDGYLRVSRKISGLNRKRKETDKILLGKTAAVGHSSFAKGLPGSAGRRERLLLEAEIS